MTRQRVARILAVAGLLLGLAPASSWGAAARPLNLVLILTDNHGAWTLGCYGNKDIRTPHIDRLAQDGTLFTRCFASNAVCSPTRATLLTGLIPSQHGVHCYLRAGEPQIGPRAYCTIQEFRTLPKVLAEQGYVCGLSGK
jgi:arylsulfatase A-like enzyme